MTGNTSYCSRTLLESNNIDSLRAFFTLVQIKLDSLILVETAKTITLNAGVMNKHVLTLFGRHEAITFGCVEPFYFAFHRINL